MIKFFLVDKKKQKTSVQAIVRYNGQRYPISTGVSVLVRFWNGTNYRCRVVREYPESSVINQKLDEWAKIIKSVFESYVLVTPTKEMVKSDISERIKKINIEVGGIAEDDDQLFIPFAEKFTKDSIRSKETKKGYITTINKLKEYEIKHKRKLRFIDINMTFYNSFSRWMLNSTYIVKGKEVYYSKNYTGSIFKNISMFMNESYGTLHEFSGHKEKGFKVESEQTDAIYLNKDELEKIFNIEFTEELLIKNGFDSRKHNLKLAIKSLNEERDRFLIGCYTALRHSDYSRLDALHFKDDLIAIWTVKKDKKVYIPMHYKLKEILKRRNNILPSPISDQKHNKQIKEIGKLAGITNEVMLSKTRGGERIENTGQKNKFITTHTARRSGATNMYLAGIDVKFIQDILGHSKVEQTLKYIKVSAEDNAKRLKDHVYFTGEKQ